MNDGRGNYLSRPLCLQLTQALTAAAEEAAVKVILLTGQGRSFSNGYDLSALTSDADQAALFDLVDTFVTAPKPIIAALQGDALGGGLELALLCAFRLVSPATRIGFPDIALGLPPTAGGTQTLPRILGAKTCLNLLLTGHTTRVHDLGPGVDAEIEGDFQAGALRFAQALADQDVQGFSMATRHEGFADPVGFQAALHEARQSCDPNNLACLDIINAVESAQLLPFAAGIEFERAAFRAAEARAGSRARRHLALCSRAMTAENAAVTSARPDFDWVAVIGQSELSFSIAAKLLLAGVNVTLLHGPEVASEDIRFDILDAARAVGQARGHADIHEAGLSDQLTLSADITDCANADVVMDASEDVGKDLEQRAEKLGAALPGHVVYMVLTEELGLSGLAKRFGRVSQFTKVWIGYPSDHCVSEACVEVTVGADRDAASVSASLKILQLLETDAVQVEGEAGVVTLALAVSLLNAAEELCLSGTPVSAVDQAMKDLGLGSGPFQWADHYGLDAIIGQNASLPIAFRQSLQISHTLVRAGRDAGATAEFYLSEDGQEGRPNPDATRAIQGLRDGRGQKSDAEHIQQSCLAALANTAAQILAAGIVRRSGDLDVLAQCHLGFETRSGGPLHAADSIGLLHLRYLLTDEDGPNAAHGALLDMIKNGQNFDAMNQTPTAAGTEFS